VFAPILTTNPYLIQKATNNQNIRTRINLTMTCYNVKDSVAFVTGTNRKNGIGRAIVESLVEHGAKKVYATARNVSQLEELVAAHNGKVVAVALDVSDLDAIQALGAKYPDVTLVVNNAGFNAETSSLGDIAMVQKEIAINYIAPLSIVQSFAPFLNKTESTESSKGSAIVNINSIASLVNFPGFGTYSASKAASHSLTQAQRREMPYCLVIGILPGPIDTDMAANVPYDKETPSSVAEAIVDALKNGTEDIYPDAMARQLHDGWKTDAKALENQMTQ
jgi:NAD(P)-dependent dehydrogenase (short-subunit alcohol dehydrogenase family)